MQGASKLLAARRDRAIAIVLGVKERECDDQLSEESSRKLRKVVLDQFNDLSSLCEDLLQAAAVDQQVVVNEAYLERLEALTDALEELLDAS